MPLPDHPLIVNGGCNCGAIRYRVSIPALCERPLWPEFNGTKTNKAPPPHIPLVALDHCDGCRSATGSILPTWLCTPLSIITSTFLLRSQLPPLNSTIPRKLTEDQLAHRTPWLPASETFCRESEYDTFLSFYESSLTRTRFFCERCGTNLAFAVVPMPEGWPDMLDLFLGSVDRKDLDGEYLEPERMFWWSDGVGWVQKMSLGCGGLKRHPKFDVNEILKDE